MEEVEEMGMVTKRNRTFFKTSAQQLFHRPQGKLAENQQVGERDLSETQGGDLRKRLLGRSGRLVPFPVGKVFKKETGAGSVQGCQE